ncbi:MAG: hypothetical protein KBC72_00350, partial [Acinetobacter sp.]|nr:hypothetical protein [Acinetobacter sp.]
SQQVISIFLKPTNHPKNLTTLAKSLFLNKFLSASPPMDVHSTGFFMRYNPLFYYFFPNECFSG